MKLHYCSMNSRYTQPVSRHSGQALVGVLVACVILIGLYAMFLGPTRNKDGTMGKSIPKKSMELAKGVAADSNIRQIGMCIDMLKQDGGSAPGDLPSLRTACKEVPSPMWVNPADGRPLLYDASAGRVYIATGPQPVGGAAPPAPAPAAADAPPPAAAAPPQLPGTRGPGGVRLPDQAPAPSMDGDQ